MIDLELESQYITVFYDELSILEPFGHGNIQPLFTLKILLLILTYWQ